MEITAEQEKESFKPVTITIKITLQEDLNNLKDIISNSCASSFCDTPMGQLNCKSSRSHIKTATKFLSNLYPAIQSLK